MRGTTATGSSWLDFARCVLLLAAVALGGARAEVIVTGGKTGTYFQIGNNLKEIVTPALEVRDSLGSWVNVEDLSASGKREYVEWIVSAKREETRKRRLDTAIEWLSEGKKHNWRAELTASGGLTWMRCRA